MASANTLEIGSLLAGGHHTLRVDEPVRLEPFESWSFPEPARVQLSVRMAHRLIEVEGTVDVVARGSCDRCLGEVARRMHIEVDERLEPETAAQDAPLSETNVLVGSRLDIADLTRQLVDSTATFAVLCRSDCSGLCQYCGQNKNEGACTCARETKEWQI
ncbi:MAG: DUF177 domain-containing protein [Candidatus Eremiobacteraeota bacterium]|nr:DUF177 domain-containing protein [Candidatus Eremiobacteraeota bacterium]